MEVRIVNTGTGEARTVRVPCQGIDRGLGGFLVGGGRVRLMLPEGTHLLLADVERLERPAGGCLW